MNNFFLNKIKLLKLKVCLCSIFYNNFQILKNFTNQDKILDLKIKEVQQTYLASYEEIQKTLIISK